MSCGILTPEQAEAVSKHVSGKVVWDVGSGDLALASKLVDLKAARVVAVDKENDETLKPPAARIMVRKLLFAECQGVKDVTFLSWPPNHQRGLDMVVSTSDVVIYLGKCTDGIMCGTPAMWHELKRREVLCVLPDSRNTLIVYGPGYDDQRKLLLEEVAGLDHSRTYSFDEWVPTRWERL